MSSGSHVSLIVGLGNPGNSYEGTRHNAGFMVIDRLRSKLRGEEKPLRGANSQIWTKSFHGRRVMLQKPMTFMNSSGEAVRDWALTVGAPLTEILLIYDDLALPLGSIRIRKKGGGGGHNGVQSVMDCLGTEAIPRLRFGIAGESAPEDQVKFVLSRFAPDEESVRDRALDLAEEAVMAILAQGLDRAMNDYNQTIEDRNKQCVEPSTKTNSEESF
jgi:PTH1 family peptidyl-tRNA hydrolase